MNKYTYSCHKLKSYEAEYEVTGCFPKEVLEAAGIAADPDDYVTILVGAEIECMWDDDIAEPGITGRLAIKTPTGWTDEFHSFLDNAGIFDDLNELVNEDARDFDGDYSIDRAAAAGDAAYDAWKDRD